MESRILEFDINDMRGMVWLGGQELNVIMELLALPPMLEKPILAVDNQFDFYF